MEFVELILYQRKINEIAPYVKKKITNYLFANNAN